MVIPVLNFKSIKNFETSKNLHPESHSFKIIPTTWVKIRNANNFFLVRTKKKKHTSCEIKIIILYKGEKSTFLYDFFGQINRYLKHICFVCYFSILTNFHRKQKSVPKASSFISFPIYFISLLIFKRGVQQKKIHQQFSHNFRHFS